MTVEFDKKAGVSTSFIRFCASLLLDEAECCLCWTVFVKHVSVTEEQKVRSRGD